MKNILERRKGFSRRTKRVPVNLVLEFGNKVGGNGHTTRILIVENSADDLLLIQRELRRGKISHVHECVGTWKFFVQAIAEFRPDLILSDHDLPGINGLDALKFAQQHCPEVPFIFVTGALGEELAIQTLTGGATDYVLKNRMSRLVPAVQRALKESDGLRQRRKAELEVILEKAVLHLKVLWRKHEAF